MPIYEYQCQNCGHEMEALQKMADAPLTRCPACNEDSLKKLVSAAAFKLTGSGWYETDFKNNNKAKAANNSDSGSGSGSSSGDSAAAAKSGSADKSSSSGADAG